MLHKMTIITALTATLAGPIAFASTFECKVTGVETWITATGHHQEGPTLSERKTESEQTKTRHFTNVVANHSLEDGKVRLVTSGEAPGGSVTLDVLESENPSIFKGSYTDGTAGFNSTVPVQCSARE